LASALASWSSSGDSVVVGGLGRGSRLGRFLPLERCASAAMMTTSSSTSAGTRDRVTDDILLQQFASR